MVQDVTDSIQSLATDSIQDSIRQTDYHIGNIFPIARGKEVFPTEMVTTDSQMKIIYNSPRYSGLTIPENKLNTDFCFTILSFSLILVAGLAVFGKKSIFAGFSLFNFGRKNEPSLGSATDLLSWPGLFRFAFTILGFGLFATIFMVLTGILPGLPGLETIKYFCIACAIITMLVLVRHLCCIIVSVFTGQRLLFMEYVSVIYSGYYIASLFLIAFSAIVLFTPLKEPSGLLWSGAGIIGLVLFIRLIRLINIFLKRRVSILYFILYLCALEVLPVLIILKALGAF